MSVSLKIYHRLPPWARTVTASLRGYYLSNWRYDAQTEKLVEEALERDYWSEQQWKKWQENRLSYILNRAAAKVPFYREHWAERRRKGDKSSWEYLENWTVLEKQSLRERNADFVAADCDRSRMFRDNTSGTTGKSLDIWSSKSTVKQWYALFEARSRRWYGVSRHVRWAILGGQLVTPFNQKKPPFWVWNAGQKQLYMSAYHLSPELIKYYLNAMIRYKIKYILGYSAAIYSLSQEIVRSNYQIKIDVVITNAEPLYDYQRSTIESAFQCPVRETYGMAEIAAAASECERGNLHIWQDTGIIQIDSGSRDQNGSGDLICTGLVNVDMPLIKYRIGDWGSVSENKCKCGRTLPLLSKIEGRSDDVLYTKDGRRIGRLDPVFKSDLNIIEAQIIQNSFKELVIKLVPSEHFDQKSANQLTNQIRERMGDIEISLEKVSKIPRTSRGKFRAVICNLSPEERAKISTIEES